MGLPGRILTFLFCLAVSAALLIGPGVAASRDIGAPENFEKLATSGREKGSTGERIAFWAEKFLGVPYDRDPLGEYVSRRAIVADERVDCMYLVFRSVELALANSPEEAISIALDKRFHSRGILRNGIVVNYEERFQYGEDMIDSGKWGREVTGMFGKMATIPDERRDRRVEYVPGRTMAGSKTRPVTGDIVFLVKKPEKRIVGEVIGHMGIIKVEQGRVYLIHAAGTKKSGGQVRKVDWSEYLGKMPYLGVKVTRFE